MSITQLQDSFPGTSLNTELWQVTTTGAAGHSVANNELTLTIPDTGGSEWNYTFIGSSATYDMTENYFAVEVKSILEGTGEFYQMFRISDDVANNGNNEYKIGFWDGRVWFGKKVNGSDTTINDIPYNSTDHRYVRIRHSGSTIYYETSPDNETWTQRAQTSQELNPSVVHVVLDGGAEPNSTVTSEPVYANAGIRESDGLKVGPVTINGVLQVGIGVEFTQYDNDDLEGMVDLGWVETDAQGEAESPTAPAAGKLVLVVIFPADEELILARMVT